MSAMMRVERVESAHTSCLCLVYVVNYGSNMRPRCLCVSMCMRIQTRSGRLSAERARDTRVYIFWDFAVSFRESLLYVYCRRHRHIEAAAGAAPPSTTARLIIDFQHIIVVGTTTFFYLFFYFVYLRCHLVIYLISMLVRVCVNISVCICPCVCVPDDRRQTYRAL